MTVLEQRAYEAICDIARSKKGEPGYWDQLRHQAAISAMQGMLSNPDLLEVVTEKKGLTKKEYADKVACVADIYATALIEKLKGE